MNRITNIDKIRTSVKYVDIYLGDHDIDYSEEGPLSIHSEIIRYSNNIVIISVMNDEYIKISEALVKGYNFKLKNNNY